MYEVKADIVKNRLEIMVDGRIKEEEVNAYMSKVNESVKKLKSGFTALLDMRKASVFDQDAIQKLSEVKQIAVKAGLTKSAMLVESATLKMQMNRNFKSIGPQDQAFTEVAEADKFLLS